MKCRSDSAARRFFDEGHVPSFRVAGRRARAVPMNKKQIQLKKKEKERKEAAGQRVRRARSRARRPPTLRRRLLLRRLHGPPRHLQEHAVATRS